LKAKARRFLRGLSSDELQFIAEFLGARILEAPESSARDRADLARQIGRFQQARTCAAQARLADQEHKMILLLEFLCRSGAPFPAMAEKARHAVN
jgi:hypothetical protein